MEEPLSAKRVSKLFIVEKGLYIYRGTMPEFLASPIRALKWKRFFQGVNAIRPGVVDLFYRGYINAKEHYAEVKGKRVDFGPEAINALYGLENYEIRHNIMPTRHDNTISLERIMLLYCIMMEIPVNVGEIIYNHLTTWVKHPHGAKPFLCLIEQLCIKDIFHETSSDPATLLVDVTKESKEGEKEKEVLKETIDNPLQGETEVFPKDADERSLPSPPKSIPKASTRLDKLKKVVREEEVDANYFFKFMDDYICKPLERGFEDIVQC
ncbi:hypothetical protein E5676_scaffold2612G00500 [Cucumis melo var. makuwa]|uniref:Putative plant transposon protein domain-containing protein n=1 Tax=Cucumis melo var. makuwa TaxID=1194695 RepID=A0A5D3BAP9_CUCMM|nr:hypothetical protein E5676_scaffold2612G00500 [Cucumis melo var. makuwa]